MSVSRSLSLLTRLCIVVSVGLSLSLRAQHGNTTASLSAKTLQPAEGLKVETFASEPLLFNPVAFSIDEKGRFFISETHRYKDAIFDIWSASEYWKMSDFSFRTVEDRAAFLAREYATNFAILTNSSEAIRLVEDKDGDGQADATALFADGFNKPVSGTAAGIMARKGQLWFTCIPDLWKLTYNATGKTTSREVLHTGYGVKISVSGHDLHGLVLGPDGKVYFSVGDRSASVISKEGKRLESIDTGAVFRCDPDGQNLEIFAVGVRNPQELAFDDYGNLWAHDNDTSGDDPSRLLYIVEGGDYGWRQAYQFMPEFGPWVREKIWQGGMDGVIPLAGNSAQGPAGLAAYPGVGLPEKYRGAILGCDFPQGVWAYFPKPQGAGYVLDHKEHFLWGFGATDVAFSPDGDVYLSDWGKSYNMPNAGRLYHVFDPAQTNNALRLETKKILSEELAKLTRIESAGAPAAAVPSGVSSARLQTLLAHPDARVRLNAQFALADAADGHAAFLSVLKNSTNLFARLHAIWGVKNIADLAARSSGTDKKSLTSVTTPLRSLLPFAADADPEVRAQVARVLGDAKFAEAKNTFLTQLKDASPRVRFFAALGLGKLQQKDAIPALLALLPQNLNVDTYLVHAVVSALVNIGDLDAIRAAAKSNDDFIRRGALLAFRRLHSPEVALFLADGNEQLNLEAARAINDVPIPDGYAALAESLDKCACHFSENPDLKTAYFLRAVNAAFRAGGTNQLTSLLNFVPKLNVPESTRVEALQALANWQKPGPLDRITGIWNPLPSQVRAPLDRAAVVKLCHDMLQTEKGAVGVATVQMIRQLKLQETAGLLAAIFSNPATPAALRVEILSALGTMQAPELAEAVQGAFASEDAALRAEAVKWSAQLNPAQAAPLLEKLLATETDVRIGQAVFATLGTLRDAAADDILVRQLDQLLAGKLRPELQLDLLEAAALHPAASVQAKVQAYQNSLAKDDALAAWRVCLAGGDKDKGKKIFNERDDVGCLRCHAIKGRGGNVGPDLQKIASRHPREYFLESILYPNRQIAPGYENVVLTLKDGRNLAGVVKSETKAELKLDSPEDGLLTVKKADIVKRDRSLSAMPDGLGALLNKRDLRDVIEYVGGLK